MNTVRYYDQVDGMSDPTQVPNLTCFPEQTEVYFLPHHQEYGYLEELSEI